MQQPGELVPAEAVGAEQEDAGGLVHAEEAHALRRAGSRPRLADEEADGEGAGCGPRGSGPAPLRPPRQRVDERPQVEPPGVVDEVQTRGRRVGQRAVLLGRRDRERGRPADSAARCTAASTRPGQSSRARALTSPPRGCAGRRRAAARRRACCRRRAGPWRRARGPGPGRSRGPGSLPAAAGPRPGQLITTSTTSDMLSRPASERPKREMSGIGRGGQHVAEEDAPSPGCRAPRAALHERRGERRRPRSPARAATSTGRMPRTSAAAGRTRWEATSQTRAPRDICSWPTDVIPPAGNQPVRTASSSRARASTMSGMASRTAVSDGQGAARRRPPRASPTTRRGARRGARPPPRR